MSRIMSRMRKALIIGGTGQVGRATARRLARAGWSVTVASRTGHRDIPDVTALRLDRADTGALLTAASGQDLVVDVVAYTPEHAAQLARLAGQVGSLVVISTGAVYRGAEDDQNALPVPVSEDWPTLAPSAAADRRQAADGGHLAYGAGKAAAERILLDTPGLPVSVLRPGTLHGPHSTSLHHWSFIKPALDRRPHVVLAYDGASRFSTSAVDNVAELIRLCADKPGTRVLNAADDEALTVAEIGAQVFAAMSHDCQIVTFPGPPRADGLGFNPWGVPRDIVLGMRKARDELGYRPAVRYDEALRADIDWALRAVGDAEAAGQSWHAVFGGLVARYGTACWFPYEAEDAYVTSVSRP
jgi:nucleoside-diphosphate-sugar epimerase